MRLAIRKVCFYGVFWQCYLLLLEVLWGSLGFLGVPWVTLGFFKELFKKLFRELFKPLQTLGSDRTFNLVCSVEYERSVCPKNVKECP